MCFESYIWIFNYRNYDTGFLNQQNPIQYACSLLLYLACQHRCQFLTSWFDCNSVSLMQVKVNTWDKCLVWLFCCFIYIQPSKQASQPALSFLCSKNKASHNKLSHFFLFVQEENKQLHSFLMKRKAPSLHLQSGFYTSKYKPSFSLIDWNHRDRRDSFL